MMARALRYRTGIDRVTGKPLTGFDHVRACLAVIWLTRLDTRIMRLEFGSDLRGALSEDLSPSLALLIYDSLIAAAHRFEPEFRLASLQFVRLSATGALAVRYAGRYYPEGRFGNYTDVETIDDPETLGLPGWLGRGNGAAA